MWNLEFKRIYKIVMSNQVGASTSSGASRSHLLGFQWFRNLAVKSIGEIKAEVAQRGLVPIWIGSVNVHPPRMDFTIYEAHTLSVIQGGQSRDFYCMPWLHFTHHLMKLLMNVNVSYVNMPTDCTVLWVPSSKKLLGCLFMT